ncbi:MAG: hypothetical protein AB7U26_09925 [Sulfuricurvum sp.]
MRWIIMTFGFFTAVALACANPSGCASGCAKGAIPLVETVTYAVNELGLEENSDIQTALRLYRKEMRTLSPKVPEEAFVGGHFNPAAYIAYSPSAKALQAQIDLFETIYLVLNDAQKKEFPRLMGMYQHHMQYVLPMKGGCGSSGYAAGCDVRSPTNCGTKNVPPASPKKPLPAKR